MVNDVDNNKVMAAAMAQVLYIYSKKVKTCEFLGGQLKRIDDELLTMSKYINNGLLTQEDEHYLLLSLSSSLDALRQQTDQVIQGINNNSKEKKA